MVRGERALPAAATWGRMQTLLAVVEHGSIRAAAESLHVTPPAVSAAITAVERELGTALFARAGRGIRLTDAGRTFAGYCRTIIGLLDEARSAVREADRARLRVGAVATASEFVLPRLMASFVRRFPKVELSLSVLPRDDIFAQVHHHELDVVLAGRPPRGSGLVTRARRPNKLVLIASPGHVGDPLTATWLLRGPGSGTRETSTGLLAQLEAAPPTLTLGTHGAVVAAAREGLGVTLVHADAVSRDIAAGALAVVPLARTPLNRPWHLSTAPQPTRGAQLFLRHVTDRGEVGDEAFHQYNHPAG